MSKGRKPSEIVAGSSSCSELPAPPAWLSKEAKREWRRVGPIVTAERQTLTLADLATFANYCTAVGAVAEASRIIAKEGLTFTAASGPRKHPAVAIRNDAMTQTRLLAGELGLTPVARSRAAIRETVGNDEDDALEGV